MLMVFFGLAVTVSSAGCGGSGGGGNDPRLALLSFSSPISLSTMPVDFLSIKVDIALYLGNPDNPTAVGLTRYVVFLIARSSMR